MCGGGQCAEVDDDDEDGDKDLAITPQQVRVIVAQAGDHRLQSAELHE